MATALDILNRAGRRSGILAAEEAYSSAEITDYLQLLNDMMHGFGPRGISYAHTTLAQGDTVNMPDELLRSLVILTAEELLIDNSMPISPVMAALITDAKNELQAAYEVVPPANTEPYLRPLPSRRYNIASDT